MMKVKGIWWRKSSIDISLKGFIEYATLFVPAWWVWIGSTYSNERYEINDVSHRLFTFLKMIHRSYRSYL
jgi:low temperature requirement protein LtrA